MQTKKQDIKQIRFFRPAKCSDYLPVLLAAVGLIAYSNSFSAPFIFDDEPAIPNNPHIRQLWPITKSMSAPPQSSVAGRPVVSLTLALNYALGAHDVRGYHAFNLLVHILAGLALYGAIRRTLLTQRMKSRFGRHATILAFCVAVIWLVHPLQTESVTYIIQRCESLFSLFYLLTLYTAIRATQSDKKIVWSALCVLCCAAGMGCKEVMVTAPVMVLLYDRTFLAGSFVETLRRRWGLYMSLAATWMISAVLLWPGPRSESAGFTFGFGPLQYAINQPSVLLRYLSVTFWPADLCLDYKWLPSQNLGQLAPHIMLTAVLLAATTYGLVRNRLWAYAGAWFFGILAPTSSFVPVLDLIFEHRMYLPLAAIVTVVVLCGYISVQQLQKKLCSRRLANYLGLSAVVLVSLLLTTRTLLRNHDYRSAESIWQKTLASAPNNPRVHLNLGRIYHLRNQLEKALEHYLRAIEIRPAYAEAHNNLAVMLKMQGLYEQAAYHFRRALKISPNYANAHFSFADMLSSNGEFERAAEHYRQAVRFCPTDAQAHYGLAIALEKLGKHEGAITHYRRALQIDPRSPEAHFKIGCILASQGKLDEAIRQFEHAVKINPEDDRAYYNLALALQLQGKLDEATDFYRQALRVRPDYAAAMCGLAQILATHGDPEARDTTEALILAKQAAKATEYKETSALIILAICYDAAGQPDKAVETIDSALDRALAENDEKSVGRLRLWLLDYKKSNANPTTDSR